MSPGFLRLVGDSICHKNYDPDDDAEPCGDDVNEVHTGYDSLSDVGENRVWFASKNLTPCWMH